MRIRMDEEREKRLRRLLEKTGESTKAGAIKHYLSDYQNKKRVADELPTDVLEELHTPYIPLGRETTVGRED